MSPKYLSDATPTTTRRYSSRNNYLMSTFFPSTITEWNKLDLGIRNSTSLIMFKGRLSQL